MGLGYRAITDEELGQTITQLKGKIDRKHLIDTRTKGGNNY